MESNILDWLYFDRKDDPMEFPKDKYVKAPPIIENMGYHDTGLGPKEYGIRQPFEANSYPKRRGLGSIKPKVSFANNYCTVEPDSETEEEKFFEIPFQYIEDDLENYVHAITIANLSSTALPLTNPDMIDWDL